MRLQFSIIGLSLLATAVVATAAPTSGRHAKTGPLVPQMAATPFVLPTLPPLPPTLVEPTPAVAATPVDGAVYVPPDAVISPAPTEHTTVTRRTLSNGLEVVVVEDHAAAVVQTGMWYRFGALDEHPGKTGLAHGLEHMMFRGTPSLSEGGFDDIMAREGVQTNANTSNDYTHFYMILPTSRLELGLKIEADRMRNLLLREDDWALEKNAVLNEYDGDLGAPTTGLYNDVCLRATPTPICGLGALGVRADIVNSRAADLRNYYDKYYHPNNATLVIVGDVHARDAIALAQKTFGAIPRRQVHARLHPVPNYRSGGRITQHGDTPYASLDFAYPSVGDFDARAGAAAVLDGVLSNPRGPLYAALVLSGVALGYESEQSSNVRGGLEHIFITVAPGHEPAEVERVFRSTMKSWLAGGIADSLVDAAKRAAAVNAIASHDAVDTLGDRVGYAEGVERRDPSFDDALVAAVTTADVTSLARATLSDPSVVGTLLPRRPLPGEAGTTGGTVSDNFTGRAPSGPIVEAHWVRALVAQPLKISSRIAPSRFQLKNGVTVLVQTVHGNGTVFVDGHIEGSPLLEPIGKDGVREMTSELLAYGSAHYDFQAQHRLSDVLGASLSFGETFSSHGLARDLPVLLGALADGELRPTFPAQYVDLIRKQTIASIDARDRDPDSLASRRLSVALLPAGDPDLRQATRATVARIVPGDFEAYRKFAYRPDLTTITVVGDVTSSEVRALLEPTFGLWTVPGPKPNLRVATVPQPRARRAHVLATRRLVEVTMAQLSIPRNSPDFVALNLLNAMLGGGGTFDTRLMHELREQRGLVYSASSGLEVGKYRGLLVMNLSTPPEHVAEAVNLAKAELVEFTKHAPSQDELNRARERLVAGSLVSEQATGVIASHVAAIGFYHLPLNYYKNLWKRYNSITPADILTVARRQLHPNHLVIVTEGPGR